MRRRTGGWAELRRGVMMPGLATPPWMARITAACFLLGGTLVAVLTSLSPQSVSDPRVQYANAAVAAAVGVLALLISQHSRVWHFHAMSLMATLQITVSVYEAVNPAVAVSFATLYVFMACSAFFVTWPVTALHLSVVVGCCLTATALTTAMPWWSGVIASGTTVAMGVVIAIIGRIVYDAELDDATGLLNGLGFHRLLGMTISRTHSGGARPVVVFFSIEGYKAIQEEFGDHAGDEVMHQVVAAWRNVLEPGQTLARRRPDELAVVLPNATVQQATSLTHRLRDATTKGCAAGVTAWQPGESAAVVIARADTALARARRSGRNRTIVESADLPSMAAELSDALASSGVDVWYQPIVGLADDSLVGVEALLRWKPLSRPDVTAADVIRVAEENNLIAALDHYVLRRACLDARWILQNATGAAMTLSVNVSGLELVQKGYVAQVFETLAETGWPADRLVLEVTESVIDVDRPSSIAALTELRSGGVRIAIDDFGTGYSSLSRLQALPTDFLKLDASFTAAVTTTVRDTPPLLQAVTALATALHLPIVAEGVETPQQASVLRHLGVGLAQGFYFGRAQTRREVVEALAPQVSTTATIDAGARDRR